MVHNGFISRLALPILARTRALVVTAMVALAGMGATVALPTTPAMASGCQAGTWGGVWGWGDCRGIGNRKWKLELSCTYGASASSSVMTGDGHVDIRCPWGSARNAGIRFL